MTTINFDSALLIRREQGPDVVEVTGSNASGKVYCFQEELPRDSAEKWLRELGFTKWVERSMGEIVSSKSGRTQPGLVDTEVTATIAGTERRVLTKQAKGYVEPSAEPKAEG